MRRSERVVDVSVEALNQLFHKLDVVCFFTRIKSHILDDLNVVDVRCETGCDWADRQLRHRGPVWATHVRTTHDLCPLVLQPLQCWNCGSDPKVIFNNGSVLSLA